MAKKETSIKVIIVEPKKAPEVKVISNDLKTLQGIVGGYIECIKQEDFDLIINEEGKLLDLEPNFPIYGGHDYIAGTAIFTGVDYKSGEFASLKEDLIEYILSIFEKRK